MEEVDDDFGDLYADVEIQASSASNGAIDFARFHEDDTDKAVSFAYGSGSKKLDVGDAASGGKSEEELNVVDDGSDSEDDFNIVLNDEDGHMFPVRSGVGVVGGSDGENADGLEQGFAGGDRGNGGMGAYHSQFSQYKYIRSHPTVCSSNLKANGNTRVPSFSSVLARCDWEENGSYQQKGSITGQVASTRNTGGPLIAQGGCGFSLPWYRTILDVNIDTFEEKPWRQPGVDLTDFFNFGFNEESWKNYCNAMEQYEKQMYMLNWTPKYRSAKLNQTNEAGFEHEKDGQDRACELGRMVYPSPKIADRLELPKGRAIQVEGSTSERQPSMDVRRPRYRDPDVVIQITVEDSVDDEIDHKDSIENESSENGDLEMGDDEDIHCFGSAGRNNPSLEETVTLNRTSVLKRSPKLSTASNAVPVDPDNLGNKRVTDDERHCCQNTNVHVSEGIAEVVEGLHNSKERVGGNTCDMDPSIMKTEFSLGEQVKNSPISYCHGSYSETSEGVYIDSKKNQNPRRTSSNLFTDQQEETTSKYYLCKNSESKDGKTKLSDRGDSVRNRSQVQEAQKHCSSRLHNVDELPSHGSNDVASPVSNTVESWYDRNHSSVGQGRWKERSHDFGSYDDDVSPVPNSEDLDLPVGHSRRKDRLCDLGSFDNDISPMSKIESMHIGGHLSVGHEGRREKRGDFGSCDTDISPLSDSLSDRGHSLVRNCRRKEWPHDFDSLVQEDLLYYRETELSFGHRNRKFGENHVHTTYTKNPRRKHLRNFGDEMDPHFRKKHFFEKRIIGSGNKMVEQHQYRHEGSLSLEEMDSFVCGERRELFLKHYSDKEMDSRWRKKNDKLQFQNITHNDDDLFHSRPMDDLTQEKYSRSVPFMYRERDYLAEKYGRDLQFTGRKANFYGRRKRYGNGPLDVDGSWSVGIDDERGRHLDHQSLSSWSYREPQTTNGGRWHGTVSPRNDVYDSRITNRHGRDRERICAERCRKSDLLGSHNDSYSTEDNITDHDSWVHIKRRKSRWRCETLHWTQNELTSGLLDENLYDKEGPLFYERTSRCTSIHAKHGFAHGRMLINDQKLQQQRYRKTRERSSDNFVNRTSNVLDQGKHEQTLSRSRKSVDLVVGEGKSSGRCPEASRKMSNDRSEDTDSKIDKNKTALKDTKGRLQRVKTVEPDIPRSESSHNNEKCLIKLNQGLDIEEGQIIPEEIDNANSIETQHASEGIPPTRNVKRRLSNANDANGNKVLTEYDNKRILQTLAKMEKRRERFKEPIMPKMEPDEIPKLQADPTVETVETVQPRPSRKRRWNGS